MKIRTKASRVATAIAACLLSPLAFGQTFTGSNTTAVINSTDHVHTITLDRGAAAASGVELTVTYNNANLALPAAPAPHPEITVSTPDLSCSVTTVGTIICGGFAGAWPQTTTVQVRFDTGATAVPTPGSPVTLAGRFLDGMGAPIATTITSGSVTIITAPPNVTLSYAPAAGSTITFPAGTALTTQNASITVTGGGTVGSGTVTNCGITGAGAGAFGAAPANITVAAGATGTLPLSCTLPNSGGAATATLTCTETDSDSTAGVSRSWPLSCPQGTPVPGPGFGASPAPNTPATAISCSGQAGSTVQRQITITNNGNPGAGSALNFTCTGSGIITGLTGGTATGLAVGASQTVTATCTVPADGVTATGTVSCTSNAPGAPFVFNYTSTGSTFPPPVPRPAVVPASSTWSQIALIALLAGLGLAFVGFRRGQ